MVSWDANREPNITGYRVSVGTTSGFYTEAYEVGAFQTSLIYPHAVPGQRYYFVVAAQADFTAWGPNSAEVSGSLETSAASVLAAATPVRTEGRATAPERRTSAAEALPTQSLSSTSTADAGTGATVLAVSPMGFGLLVHAERFVRTFSPAGVSDRIVLELPAGTTLHDLALDPSFDSSGLVYGAVATVAADGSVELTLTRWRLAGDVLGEATVMARESAAPDTRPTVAAGGGRVFMVTGAAVRSYPAGAEGAARVAP